MDKIRSERVRAHSPVTLEVRCSLLDHLVRELPVPVVFFYDRLLDVGALKHALGRVLGDFPVFDARIRRRGDDLYIDCNGNGVSFSYVKSPKTSETALTEIHSPARRELVEVIDAKRAVTAGTPVLTVRVTHFVDGKSCLGVCWHHSVGDMHTFMRLMQAWSRTVAGLSYDAPLVVDDRIAHLEQHLPAGGSATPGMRHLGLGDLGKLIFYMLTKARDQKALAFYFDPSEIERLRASMQQNTDERLSTNDVLSAHMFSLTAGYDPKPRTRTLGIALNFRKRMGLSDALLGNMITGVNSQSAPGTPASQLARDIRRSVDRFADERMDYRVNVEFVNQRGGLGSAGRFLMRSIDPISGSLLVTNWGNFGVYGIDFGGAAPTFFSAVSEFPFPWLSGLVEGFGNRGMLYTSILPTAIAERLASPEGVRAVHAHREAPPELPESARALPWLL
jgi:shikimate O-hydroxycinnamoyltransferase